MQKHVKAQCTPVSHQSNVTKQVLLSKEHVPHITQFAKTSLQPGDTIPEHSHSDMYETFHILSGVLSVKIDDVSLELQPGETLVIEPKEMHSLNNFGDEQVDLIYFGSLQ